MLKLVVGFSIALVGCTTEHGSGGSAEVGDTTCDDACTRYASLCGDDPTCASWCPMISDAHRNCIANAASCTDVMACSETPEPDAGSDTDASVGGGGTVCLDYATSGEDCSVSCSTRVVLEDGLFCSRDCATADDCGSGFHCASSTCLPACTSGNTDDDSACTALGWKECASGFDGFTTFYYCTN